MSEQEGGREERRSEGDAWGSRKMIDRERPYEWAPEKEGCWHAIHFSLEHEHNQL